jgi:nucleoredoxin
LFVSGDSDVASFESYFREMSFCAIPFEELEARSKLEKRLEICGYPTLLMLGPKPSDEHDNFGDRPVINAEVRAVIENGDYISDFPYYPKPYGDLCRTTDDINMHKCLIVFHEGGDPEDQDEIEETVKQAADEYRGDELIKFYWANDPEAPLALNTRQACHLGVVGAEPTMILLDIPDDGAYYVSEETDITVATVMYFLVNKSERQQI